MLSIALKQRRNAMTIPLTAPALDQLFRSARTPTDWADVPLDDDKVHALYDLLKWGPTSANCSPARFVWVRSAAGKERLASLANEMNGPRILAAPLTVIVGHDLAFPDTMPRLFPDRREIFRQYFSQPGVAEHTAFRNGSLQRRLPDRCCPRAGFGLRPHVRLRQRRHGPGVLQGHTH
jgi:3-hydroxypropanoate dehydrogenase